MAIVYRLGHVDFGTALPARWAYGDTADAEPGFPVWLTLGHAVHAAATGADVDGRYPAATYPVLLVVEAVETHDGPGEWGVVRPGDVLAVRAVPTAAVCAWAWEQAIEAGDAEDEDDDRGLLGWVEDHEAELVAFVEGHAKPLEITWAETLGGVS
jgi:hypothetical protein